MGLLGVFCVGAVGGGVQGIVLALQDASHHADSMPFLALVLLAPLTLGAAGLAGAAVGAVCGFLGGGLMAFVAACGRVITKRNFTRWSVIQAVGSIGLFAVFLVNPRPVRWMLQHYEITLGPAAPRVPEPPLPPPADHCSTDRFRVVDPSTVGELVHDRRTNLFWSRAEQDPMESFVRARALCRTRRMRLARSVELRELAQDTRSRVPQCLFFAPRPGGYWTSSIAGAGQRATILFPQGEVSSAGVDEVRAVRCVRRYDGGLDPEEDL